MQEKNFVFWKYLHEPVTNFTLLLRKVGWLSKKWLFRRFKTVTGEYNMSKEMQELQKQWHSVVESIHSNSNVGLN